MTLPDPTTASLAAERKARILAAVRSEPALARPAVNRRDLLRVATALAMSVVLFVALGGPHARLRPMSLVASSSLVWGVVAAAVTFVALRRGRSMLGLPRLWMLLATLAAPPLLAVTWFLLPSALVTTAIPHAAGIDAHCFTFTLLLGASPLVALLALRREADPVSPTVTAAALGAAAGAWGAVLIDLHCDLTDPTHVLVGHVLPVVVLATVGALAGPMLALRATRRS